LNSAATVDKGPFQVQQNASNIIDNIREDFLAERKEHFGDQFRRINTENTLRSGFINIHRLLHSTGIPKNKILLYYSVATK
jgi:hypothetical protein